MTKLVVLGAVKPSVEERLHQLVVPNRADVRHAEAVTVLVREGIAEEHIGVRRTAPIVPGIHDHVSACASTWVEVVCQYTSGTVDGVTSDSAITSCCVATGRVKVRAVVKIRARRSSPNQGQTTDLIPSIEDIGHPSNPGRSPALTGKISVQIRSQDVIGSRLAVVAND